MALKLGSKRVSFCNFGCPSGPSELAPKTKTRTELSVFAKMDYILV